MFSSFFILLFVCLGDLDIDRVLSQRSQSVPRTVMGTAMLSRTGGERASPSTSTNTGGDNGGEEATTNLLPATLEEFSKRQPPPEPKIHDPPKGPESCTQTAPQRFKKGNLRLIQTDDGGWRLEEIEDRRRSIEYKPDLDLSPGKC
ncbi:MAG: hypothetical protein GY738_27825 [Pseudoalteromonas sp.]|nr:hypothetical protein [Pseudoalteromonas sp.]